MGRRKDCLFDIVSEDEFLRNKAFYVADFFCFLHDGSYVCRINDDFRLIVLN